LSSSLKQFYSKYRELIRFNRNILISAIASIIADAIVVGYLAAIANSAIVVSISSIVTDTGVYVATFALVFYIDNKKRYLDSATGKKDSTKFNQDLKKIITTLGISELVYITAKFTSIYLLLQIDAVAPYQTAMITTLIAWVFYIATANAISRQQNLFK
jgi:hypothetical protein